MSRQSNALQVILLAAGKGVRMRSAVPKALHRVCGQTLLERALRVLVALNPSQVVVVIGHGEQAMRDELARLTQLEALSELRLTPVLQPEQRGTGHAAECGLRCLDPSDANVLIVPADVPLLTSSILAHLLQGFAERQAEVAFLSCVLPDPAGFGRVIRDPHGCVTRICEHRDCSPVELEIKEINSSIYLARDSFLRQALKTLEPNNAQAELYLTDIVACAADLGLPVEAVCSAESEALSGANTRYELSLLEGIRRRQIARAHMEAGVSLEAPDSVFIDEGVQLSPDCFLGAGTRLFGSTVLQRGVVVEGNSIVVDSVVGEGSRINFCSVVESSVIGSCCRVGPFAHLRPGSRLHESVHVGNFVETKKAELAAGVKANHLSYIGDAHVGKGTNIGAGTITCNYDGRDKHRTSIGEFCFVGSNTCLVAPVTVGDGAYIGAGSTITKEIPPGALGLGRARQENIEGWARRKRKKKEE